MTVTSAAVESAMPLIALALDEDLQQRGDLTSQATIPLSATADVIIAARDRGVLSGTVLIEPVCAALAERMPDLAPCTAEIMLTDGATLEPGSVIGQVTGPVRALLSGERTVLNFLTHLSGIASRTAEFVARTGDSDAVILDTRKTLPGYRVLQKYAVHCGGGTNHRMGLYDGILIKDNHLAASPGRTIAGSITAARDYLTSSSLELPVEVEVDTLDQLRDALQAQPDIVLLDNMSTADLQQAVRIRDKRSPATLLEASGGITLETVGCIAGTGIDRISIGGLTHSAPALDIGYDWPEHE